MSDAAAVMFDDYTPPVPTIPPPGYRPVAEAVAPDVLRVRAEQIDDDDPRLRVYCPYCDNFATRSVTRLQDHLSQIHPEKCPPISHTGRRPKGWTYELLGLDPAPWAEERAKAVAYTKKNATKNPPRRSKAAKAAVERIKAAQPLEQVEVIQPTIDLDRLNEAVLGILFPDERIPLRLLGQIDMWRAATATLVAAIQGE